MGLDRLCLVSFPVSVILGYRTKSPVYRPRPPEISTPQYHGGMIHAAVLCGAQLQFALLSYLYVFHVCLDGSFSPICLAFCLIDAVKSVQYDGDVATSLHT